MLDLNPCLVPTRVCRLVFRGPVAEQRVARVHCRVCSTVDCLHALTLALHECARQLLVEKGIPLLLVWITCLESDRPKTHIYQFNNFDREDPYQDRARNSFDVVIEYADSTQSLLQ